MVKGRKFISKNILKTDSKPRELYICQTFFKNQGRVKTAVGSELSLVSGTYHENKVSVVMEMATLRAKSSRISSRHGTEKRERLCRTCVHSLWSR
jgi:hypothetical protein